MRDFSKHIEEELDEIARELGFNPEGQILESKVQFINEKLSVFGFREQALEYIKGYVDLLQTRTRYPDMLRLGAWTYLMMDQFRRTHTFDLSRHISPRSLAGTGPPSPQALARLIDSHRRLTTGLWTMTDPDELRSRIRGFPEKYVKDWSAWCMTMEQNGLHSIEAANGLVSVLRKFQAARGVKNRKLQTPVEVRRLLEIESVAKAIDVLSERDLRTFQDPTAEQKGAVKCLWRHFRDHLFRGGPAGEVGITKAIMLVTKGNMGPAMDSFVRTTIECGRISTADDLIAVYREVACWVAELEKRNGIRLETDLVPKNWQSLNVGRVVDMVFGPRQARATDHGRIVALAAVTRSDSRKTTRGSVTFWRAVEILRTGKAIPQQWRVRDIFPHLIGQFSARTIKTVPANQSISRDGSVKGNYVVKGARPMVYRVQRGLYELIDDPS